MTYRIVIETDPDPDTSWLEQSSYDPSSPDYDPIYPTTEDMNAGTNAYDPDHYRDPSNHDVMTIELYRESEGYATDYIDSVGDVDYYPAGTAPEGSWDVDGPDDLPAEWDAFTTDTVRNLDWPTTEDNFPTVYIDGEDAREYEWMNALDDPIERVQVSFGDAENGSQTPAQERGPLGWLNSASINLDRAGDSCTVNISVGDPRGAFAFTVRRLDDGSLIMHTPYPGEPMPHRDTAMIRPGTYKIG